MKSGIAWRRIIKGPHEDIESVNEEEPSTLGRGFLLFSAFAIPFNDLGFYSRRIW
jgi:hypothetical protein